MGGAFVITLRETFEATLLLGIVYSYLDRIGCRDQYRHVTRGGALGVLASVALGIVVTVFSGPILDLGPDLIAAVVMFLAVGLLTWHTWWMRRHAQTLRGELEGRIDTARRSRRLWIVGLIAFVGVFREGSETVLFLWGLWSQAALGSGRGGAVGALVGILAAAALGWAVFRGSRRIPLQTFFAATSILLLFLAAGLFSAGVGRLQGLGLLPFGESLWDTSGLLDDRSLVGSFLAGLIGYRTGPTALEVGAYAVYLTVAGLVLFGPAWRPARAPAAVTRPTPRG